DSYIHSLHDALPILSRPKQDQGSGGVLPARPHLSAPRVQEQHRRQGTAGTRSDRPHVSRVVVFLNGESRTTVMKDVETEILMVEDRKSTRLNSSHVK